MSVSWNKLLASGEVTTHRTGKQELDKVRALTEAAELVRKAGEFHALVERWVAANHAALAKY
jgi:hypothetical protein